HIDCRDEICPPALLKAELEKCKRLARRQGLEQRSFVHPGHTIGNLDILAQEGLTNFRTDYRNVLGYPKKHASGLWELEQTAEFVLRKGWSIDYHVHRYRTILKRAMASNTVCVLWFHPSFDPIVVKQILPLVFSFIRENKAHIWVTTHCHYIDWLERNR
ncbi:MAG: polysaccharide deacetylase, partial [Desulfobacterales bacterium]|nr:polysaccharide deacetylase [Desulfobacterales bacterium]